MLVQDTLTGAVHEVPESQLYEADYAESPEQMAEGQMLYDGLGNPVGFSFKRFAQRAFRAASKLAPLASLVPVPGAASADPSGPAGASRCNTPVGSGGSGATTRPSARSGAAVCPCGASISAGSAGSSATRKRRRLLRGGSARPADARAGLATAARMDSPPIALPGHEGASHLFAMRLLARPKGLGPRDCRTGATGARSRCPTSPAGARSQAGSHGTAICSPPPALVHSPVSETSLCAGA